MSSNIQTSVRLVQAESGLSPSGVNVYESVESAFSSNSISVVASEESVAIGDVLTPRPVFLSNLGPDDLKVGLATGVYPLRIASGRSMLLELDVAGRQEITSVTCPADAEGARLGGTYFVLNSITGIVWPWFATASLPEISRITVASVTGIGSDYVDLYDDSNLLRRFWINTGADSAPSAGGGTLVEVVTTGTTDQVQSDLLAAIILDGFDAEQVSTYIQVTAGSGGTRSNVAASSACFTVSTSQQGIAAASAPSVTTQRLVEVSLEGNETAAEVATAIYDAIVDDAEFTVTTEPTSNVVLIRDRHTGTRTDSGAGTTSGFTISTTQQGAASPSVFLKSDGTSQVVVGVAPN